MMYIYYMYIYYMTIRDSSYFFVFVLNSYSMRGITITVLREFITVTLLRKPSIRLGCVFLIIGQKVCEHVLKKVRYGKSVGNAKVPCEARSYLFLSLCDKEATAMVRAISRSIYILSCICF